MALALTRDDVKSLNPSMLPFSPKPMVIAYGQAELPELQAQSQVFFDQRVSNGLPGQLLALPGLNHFTILPVFASPEGVLALAAKQLAFN